jgi:Phage integrase, N-terminal SAM-like domain
MKPSTLPPLKSARLLDQMRERIRYCHCSLRTEQAYLFWVRRFIRFHRLRHPRSMGSSEVEEFLTHLAAQRQVAPSTHKQALAALLFLHRQVLDIELPWTQQIGRPLGITCNPCARKHTVRGRPPTSSKQLRTLFLRCFSFPPASSDVHRPPPAAATFLGYAWGYPRTRSSRTPKLKHHCKLLAQHDNCHLHHAGGSVQFESRQRSRIGVDAFRYMLDVSLRRHG